MDKSNIFSQDSIPGKRLAIFENGLSDVEKKTKIRHYIESVEKDGPIPQSDLDLILQLLADFECWEYFSDLAIKIAEESENDLKFDYYLLAAKAWGLFAHDLERCADVMLMALDDLELKYDEFFYGLYLPALEPENYENEATILSKIVDHDLDKIFIEQILERLAMIYDKKLHLDKKHDEIQERLLQLNPSNHKSLKYFKIKNQQNHDWDTVGEILNKLIETSEHSVERARFGLELAVLSLYFLNSPERAIRVLDEHVGESFDSDKIRLVSLKDLGQYERALELLDAMIKKSDDDDKATVFFHYGKLLNILEQFPEAQDKFKESFNLRQNVTTLLELTRVSVKLKDNENLREILKLAIEFADVDQEKRAMHYLDELSGI